MRNFTSAQKAPASGSKKVHFAEQLKALTIFDILSCIFCGVLSRGTFFGTVSPFGLALYAAYSGNGFAKAIMTISIISFNLFGGDFLKALKQTATIFLFEWLIILFKKNSKEAGHIGKAFFMAVSSAITGILVFLINGQLMLEFVFILINVMLIAAASPIISLVIEEKAGTKEYQERNHLKLLGFLILLSAFLLGISGFSIFGIQADAVMAGICVLMLARHFDPGIAACAGAIAGISVSRGGIAELTSLAGVYAITGMTAGILKKSKMASGIAFFIIQAVVIILSKEYFTGWAEIVIPTVLFILLPDIKPGRIHALKCHIGEYDDETQKVNRVKSIVTKKLSDISKALIRLANTVEKQIKDRLGGQEINANAVIEQLTAEVCSQCAKGSSCWDMGLVNTYKTVICIASRLEEGTTAHKEHMKDLGRFCAKPSAVLEALSKIIEIKRIEKIWQGIVYDSISIIPEQIYGMSEIIKTISGGFFREIAHHAEEEKKIKKALTKKGYLITNVEVNKNRCGRFTCEIQVEGCRGRKDCIKSIETVTSGILGLPMKVEEGECKDRGKENCFLFLKEKEVLGVTTGIARVKKNKSGVSGDSFTFLKTRDGEYVVAISDGMGSGSEANRLSETTIGLLEQLIDCGLSIRDSLRMINIMMSMNPEKYSTVDISVIDLYSGNTEFYKMGAVPSIIANGKDIELIQTDNLPAGFLTDSAVRPEKRKISDGEFVIMMTDGLYDRLNGSSGKNMIKRAIVRENTLNPQELAEHLLEKACSGKKAITDDMTVIITKLWRKTG
ncbi:MAG TPA: stage II sporulation protein E [Ruminiclostridium sp.]|jgi:stage II sporulation protein E|nr:SpoIIE family protein phosphatase [Clostridiaceae bacterium]HAA25041.1 stage II sporulation protein E [Ruminiclostridium sp.]